MSYAALFIRANTLSIVSLIFCLLCLSCSGATDEEDDLRRPMFSMSNYLSEEHQGANIQGDTYDYTALRINEINARNEPYDWVEFVNLSDDMINLGGCFLSDDPTVPMKSLISNAMELTIPPRSYLVIALTDQTFGFKLGKEDHILITSPQGDVIDQFSYRQGEAIEGEVFARIPDGDGELTPSNVPTPSESNNPSQYPEIEAIDDYFTQSQSDLMNSDPSAIEPQVKDLRINEIAAKGEPADWVELYNPSEVPIPLVGLQVTDDLDSQPFVLADGFGELAPQSFIIIEISDETVGFKLSSEEAFYLLDGHGEMIDQVDWNEGDSSEGFSYARVTNGSGEFISVTSPTPGSSNELPNSN